MMCLFAILVALGYVQISRAFYMTRDECKHAGVPYKEPQIVKEFRTSPIRIDSKDISRNDIIAHHRLTGRFCKERARLGGKRKKCTWDDYYYLLDDLREPFVNLYDPGLDPIGQPLQKIQSEGKSGASYQSGCDVIENPTSEIFYDYVVNNKPAIIRGLAKDWPATKKWKDEYLLSELHGKLVRDK
jgi:Cupin-like domain